MKDYLKQYSKLIRIVIIFLAIIIFSCSGGKKPEYSPIAGDVGQEVTEKLTPDEEQKLASLFTGSLTASLDSLMDVYARRFRFHGNVLLSYNRMLCYRKAIGTADFQKNVPLQPDSRFQLASVSKQFTAAGIMMLKEQGKLSYGDTVSNIIPGFPYERVTIKQLLHHTAGMPNYMWLLEHKWKEGKEAYNDDIIRLMDKHNTHLYFTPGYRYDYSNTGYAVLAYIIEVLTGERYGQFMKKNFFEPLEMQNTFVYSNALNRDYPDRLQGYYRRWRRYNPIEETVHDGIVGDKNVYSTINDLYRWDQALYDGNIISAQTLEEAFTPLKVRGKWEYPYGYGFRIKTVNGKKVVYHTGLWEGFRTNFMRYVEDENTIIILNHTNTNVNSILVKKIESLLDQTLTKTPVQEIVNVAITEGYQQGLERYTHFRENDEQVDVKKILRAAELLSDMNKPQMSSILVKLYQKSIASLTVNDRYKD